MRRFSSKAFTLLELLVTVAILSVLSAISLIGIGAPKQLLEEETVLNQLSMELNGVQERTLWQSASSIIAWTPWALWVDNEKRVEFPQNGPWQWQGTAVKLSVSPQPVWAIRDEHGKEWPIHICQPLVTLKHYQKTIAVVVANPTTKQLQLLRPDKVANGSCYL